MPRRGDHHDYFGCMLIHTARVRQRQEIHGENPGRDSRATAPWPALPAAARRHPQFIVTALAASDARRQPYAEACTWRSRRCAAQRRRSHRPGSRAALACDSCSRACRPTSRTDRDAVRPGRYPVISNSSSHRMDDAVPLLVPRSTRTICAAQGRSGGLHRDESNCSTVMIALALRRSSRASASSGVVTRCSALGADTRGRSSTSRQRGPSSRTRRKDRAGDAQILGA